MSRPTPEQIYKDIKPPKADELKQAQDKNTIKQVRRYKLITPLFGGGVEAGITDDVTPISGKAIRGHLRFWWRATRGGQFGGGEEGLQKMKEAEETVWGGASGTGKGQPSSVKVEVKATNLGQPKNPFVVESKLDENRQPIIRNGVPLPRVKPEEGIAPSYAAFPLQPKEEDGNPLRVGQPTKSLRENIEFTLTMSFPKNHKIDVEAALWSWETFGGIGARTRRGFGALFLNGYTENGVEQDVNIDFANNGEVHKYILTGLDKHVSDGDCPQYVPRLQKKMSFRLVGLPPANFFDSSPAAWKHIIQKLKDFRQMRHNRGRGRSYWTEPDQIRYLTDQTYPNHKPPLSDIEKFPRGSFGLPIIFHFKDWDERNPYSNNVDPIDSTLKPAPINGKNLDRRASPLILRPLRCSSHRNTSVGLAAMLVSQPPPNGYVLEFENAKGKQTPKVIVGLEQDEANEIEPLKMRDGTHQKNVLLAFLDYVTR